MLWDAFVELAEVLKPIIIGGFNVGIASILQINRPCDNYYIYSHLIIDRCCLKITLVIHVKIPMVPNQVRVSLFLLQLIGRSAVSIERDLKKIDPCSIGKRKSVVSEQFYSFS